MAAITTITMSTKGQVVIPRELRERLGWGAGTLLQLHSHGGGVILRPIRPFVETQAESLLGLLAYAGPPRSIEEMNDAIAQGAAASARRVP